MSDRPLKVGKEYDFDKVDVIPSSTVESPDFYRSKKVSTHIEDGRGQMPYGCETVDVDALIRQVLSGHRVESVVESFLSVNETD